MKAISRQELIKLPTSTLFSRIDGGVINSLSIKKSNFREWINDFTEQDLLSEINVSKKENNYNDFYDMLENVPCDNKFTLDYDMITRDGMYDENQIYVIWDNDDIGRLIEQLKACII